QTGPAGGAPAKEGDVSAGQIGFEIVKRLRLFAAGEGNLYAFRRSADMRHTDNGVTEARQENIKDRQRSADISTTQISTHFLGDEILKPQNRIHRHAQRN